MPTVGPTVTVCEGEAVLLRPRKAGDLAACARLLRTVHHHDGYPVVLPEDELEFLVVPDTLGAWVALDGLEIVGHVALHRRSNAPVMALAAAVTGGDPEAFGVVARLLVAPSARRRGIARALLERAAGAAVERHLRPMLDVVTEHRSAIALYDRCGWQCIGSVTVGFGGGLVVEELVYLAPATGREPTGGEPTGTEPTSDRRDDGA